MPIQKLWGFFGCDFYAFLAALFVTPSYYHTFLPHLVITISARLFIAPSIAPPIALPTALPTALLMELLAALF
jgi:hypothetical protein